MKNYPMREGVYRGESAQPLSLWNVRTPDIPRINRQHDQTQARKIRHIQTRTETGARSARSFGNAPRDRKGEFQGSEEKRSHERRMGKVAPFLPYVLREKPAENTVDARIERTVENRVSVKNHIFINSQPEKKKRFPNPIFTNTIVP